MDRLPVHPYYWQSYASHPPPPPCWPNVDYHPTFSGSHPTLAGTTVTGSSTHCPTGHPGQGQQPEPLKFTYLVRIYVNPKKKSEYVVRMWHDVDYVFESTTALKVKLMDSFRDDVPPNTDFQIGYFEGRGHTKRWIVDNRDLQRMYSVYESGSTISLWSEGRKLNSHDDGCEPAAKKTKTASKTTKREQSEEETDEIFAQLKQKHSEMAAPKLRLWAKLIQSGRHDSYDEPPNIPLITGSPAPTKPKKESVVDALTGAATAVVKLIQQGNSTSTSSPQTPGTPQRDRTPAITTYVSPLKLAQLRRSCLDDLKKLKELLDDGVLTEEEFSMEKQHILSTLTGLK